MVVDATHLAFGHAAPFAAGEFVGARAYAPISLIKPVIWDNWFIFLLGVVSRILCTSAQTARANSCPSSGSTACMAWIILTFVWHSFLLRMVVDATHLAFGHAAPFAAGEFVGARAYAPIYLFKLIRRVSLWQISIQRGDTIMSGWKDLILNRKGCGWPTRLMVSYRYGSVCIGVSYRVIRFCPTKCNGQCFGIVCARACKHCSHWGCQLKEK